ncbi:hypothetical protein K8T06_05140 [bacterium]|nr:hypothetical protein [bacterium]
MNNIENRFISLIQELMEEYSYGYVALALKQINDQQLLHLSFGDVFLQNDPILLVYDQIVNKLEKTLFDSRDGISSIAELKKLIQQALNCLKQDKLGSLEV